MDLHTNLNINRRAIKVFNPLSMKDVTLSGNQTRLIKILVKKNLKLAVKEGDNKYQLVF
jgi:hypothetical protein